MLQRSGAPCASSTAPHRLRKARAPSPARRRAGCPQAKMAAGRRGRSPPGPARPAHATGRGTRSPSRAGARPRRRPRRPLRTTPPARTTSPRTTPARSTGTAGRGSGPRGERSRQARRHVGINDERAGFERFGRLGDEPFGMAVYALDAHKPQVVKRARVEFRRRERAGGCRLGGDGTVVVAGGHGLGRSHLMTSYEGARGGYRVRRGTLGGVTSNARRTALAHAEKDHGRRRRRKTR